MKKLLLNISIVCSLGLIASTALAVVSTTPATRPLVNGQQGVTSTKVPQAQIDLFNKRQEMKQRRADMLKVRQQLIQADSPGNVDGTQPIQ